MFVHVYILIDYIEFLLIIIVQIFVETILLDFSIWIFSILHAASFSLHLKIISRRLLFFTTIS